VAGTAARGVRWYYPITNVKSKEMYVHSPAVTPVSLSVFTCLDPTRGKAPVTRGSAGREKGEDKDISIRLKKDRGKRIGRDK